MSDVPQGPGWWQASDDKWYPPPRPTMPGEEEGAPVATSAPPEGMAPPMGVPSGPYAPPGPGPGPMGPPPGPGAPMGAPGYYPPGAPPGGGNNRTPLFIALAVVAVAALLGVILVATSGGDDDPTTGSTASPNTSTQGTSGTTAPPSTEGPDTGTGGGAEDIEVVETGFSNFDAQFDSANHVSYGYILENSGEEGVANVEVTVTLKDADGTVVASDTDTIYYIPPGGKIGLGDEPYEELAEVAEVDVQASIPSYAGEADETGEIAVDGISTTEDSSTWKTTFTATSSYEVQIDSPYAYVIYRNSAGDIVGGSYNFMNVMEPGGSTSGEVSSYEPIPGVDPSKTEVYVDPGYLY
jgi:hypothetical protein